MNAVNEKEMTSIDANSPCSSTESEPKKSTNTQQQAVHYKTTKKSVNYRRLATNGAPSGMNFFDGNKK